MDPTVAEILNPTKPKSNVNWIFIAGLGMAVVAFAFVILKPQSTLPGVDPIVTPDISKPKYRSNCPVFQTKDANDQCKGCCNDYGQPGWMGIGDNQCPEPNIKCIAPKTVHLTDENNLKRTDTQCSVGDLAVAYSPNVNNVGKVKKSVLACCPGDPGGNMYVRMLNNLDADFDVGSIKQLCCPKVQAAWTDGYVCDANNIGGRKMIGDIYSRKFEESICKKTSDTSASWIELTKDTPINDGGTMLTGCTGFSLT